MRKKGFKKSDPCSLHFQDYWPLDSGLPIWLLFQAAEGSFHTAKVCKIKILVSHMLLYFLIFLRPIQLVQRCNGNNAGLSYLEVGLSWHTMYPLWDVDHRERKRSIRSSSFPKHWLQNVISSIFSSQQSLLTCVHSVMLVFSAQLCDLYSPLLPLSLLLSDSPLPFPQFPWISICTYTACKRGREGYRVVSETIFCRSFTLCIWPDSEFTKLLDHPKQKLRRGGGLDR